MSLAAAALAAITTELERQGITQRRLSELAGISQPNLSKYFSGKMEPSASILDRMAVALGTSIELLLNGRPSAVIPAGLEDRVAALEAKLSASSAGGERARLHALIDALNPDDLRVVNRLLGQFLTDYEAAKKSG